MDKLPLGGMEIMTHVGLQDDQEFIYFVLGHPVLEKYST
jgi:hypothetical protein